MASSRPRFPDRADLESGLSAMHGVGGAVRVLARRPNVYASTFPSEVVRCRLPDGSVRRLLCKYTVAGEREHFARGHRRGVGYESDVYGRVLGPLGVTAPRLFGAAGARGRKAWLALEFVDDAERLEHAGDVGFVPAGRWIGEFHRKSAALVRKPAATHLVRYDAAYYAGWARRFRRFTRATPHARGLAPLCERFDEVIDTLLAAPQVVIHGEYYPKNILLSGGRIHPVDWETAAVAAGEIDLASLTEGWPEETAARCVRAYRAARWPRGSAAGFGRRLDAARVYLAIRWLGDLPQSHTGRGARSLFAQLRTAGQRLGLVA